MPLVSRDPFNTLPPPRDRFGRHGAGVGQSRIVRAEQRAAMWRELAAPGMALTRGRLATVNTVINGGNRLFSKPAAPGMALTRGRLSTVNTVINGGDRLFSKPTVLGMALKPRPALHRQYGD